jgi:hypothetical protein
MSPFSGSIFEGCSCQSYNRLIARYLAQRSLSPSREYQLMNWPSGNGTSSNGCGQEVPIPISNKRKEEAFSLLYVGYNVPSSEQTAHITSPLKKDCQRRPLTPATEAIRLAHTLNFGSPESNGNLIKFANCFRAKIVSTLDCG